MVTSGLQAKYRTQQEERRWNHEPISGRELHGKRVGIVGYGATGRYLATVCKALGMEVWATKRRPVLIEGEPLDRLLPAHGLHELLGASDYDVVTASLNSTTRFGGWPSRTRLSTPLSGATNL